MQFVDSERKQKLQEIEVLKVEAEMRLSHVKDKASALAAREKAVNKAELIQQVGLIKDDDIEVVQRMKNDI